MGQLPDVLFLSKKLSIGARMAGIAATYEVIWVGYFSGFRMDLAKLCEMVHSAGAELLVNAIQGLGVFSLNSQEIPIGYLAADGHKWMLGPEGAGFFSFGKANWRDWNLSCRAGASVFRARSSDRLDDELSGIITFNVRGVEPMDVRKRLLDEQIVVSVRHGRLRIATHAYNDQSDIDRLVETIRSLCR